MASEGGAPIEDSRSWAGRVRAGAEADHERFVGWLDSDEAREIFRRRRLTEYRLSQEGDRVMVVFRAPHTGDPRIMIDFLRYPGVWPEFWEFEQAGRGDEEIVGDVRVHWRREGGAAGSSA